MTFLPVFVKISVASYHLLISDFAPYFNRQEKLMERTITYHIDSAAAGLRIEQYLRRRGYSYQNLTQLKKMHESILLNGVWSYMRASVQDGDILTVHIQGAGIFAAYTAGQPPS